MFGGHAPPFGWYCSASKSRSSAPRSIGRAAPLPRRTDAALRGPVNCPGRLGSQGLGVLEVGDLVQGLPAVLGVLVERIVLAGGGLDAALSLGRVARLKRALRRQ